MLEAVVLCHRDGEAEAAGLEGASGVRSLFLDVQARVALAVEHRRPACAEGDRGDVGQDIGVAPHAKAGRAGSSAGGNFFTLRGVLELVHVVTDVEGAGAEGAEGLGGVGGEVVVAARAFQGSNGRHISDITRSGLGEALSGDKFRRGVSGRTPLVGCARGFEGRDRLVALEPAASREVGDDAGGEQDETEGDGSDDPERLEMALEQEAVEQSQDKDQNCRLGKEGRTTMRRDGDEIEERGGALLGYDSDAGRNEHEACGRDGGLGWSGSCLRKRSAPWSSWGAY